MIRTRLVFSALVLAAFCTAPKSLFAQDIDVYGGNRVHIADAFDQASVFNGTYFQQVSIGDEKEYQLTVYNKQREVDVVLDGPVTLSGAHPGDFEVYFPYTAIGIGFAPLGIKFKPTVAGPRSAIVTINSNTPGSKAAYSFSLGGVGVIGPVAPTYDLIVVGPTTGANSKTNKKGETKVRWKLKVYNYGPVATEGGLVAFYRSDDQNLSFIEDTFVSEKAIKPLPAMVEGKKIARKKVKFKGTFTDGGGDLFAVVSGYPATPIENEIVNNIVSAGY